MSSTTPAWTRPGRFRPMSAILSATALTATSLLAAAGPANAVITAGGAEDAEGRPAFVRDAEGVALQLCTADEPACEAADPLDPLHGGYFGAEAEAGPFLAIYGIETAADEENGGAFVANVTRFRANGVRPNATYTVRDPWGTTRVTADDRGRVNHLIESGGEVGTIAGGHVTTFLRLRNNPDGLLGDLDTVGLVTGSPTGFNQVTVTGPGLRPGGVSTNRFTVTGQMREDTAMSSVGRTSMRMGSLRNARPVRRAVRYSSFGTADAVPQVRVRGPQAARFRVRDNCTSVAPGSTCTITVTYVPRANRSASAVLVVDDNSLAAPRRIQLQGTGPDTRAPRVASMTPARSATGVPLGKSVGVRFDEVVRGVKGSFALVDNSTGRQVAARVTRRGASRFVLDPRRALSPRTTYTVRLDGGRQGIRDRVGNAARDLTWQFRTR